MLGAMRQDDHRTVLGHVVDGDAQPLRKRNAGKACSRLLHPLGRHE
jgi:hypothetical protein